MENEQKIIRKSSNDISKKNKTNLSKRQLIVKYQYLNNKICLFNGHLSEKINEEIFGIINSIAMKYAKEGKLDQA